MLFNSEDCGVSAPNLPGFVDPVPASSDYRLTGPHSKTNKQTTIGAQNEPGLSPSLLVRCAFCKNDTSASGFVYGIRVSGRGIALVRCRMRPRYFWTNIRHHHGH